MTHASIDFYDYSNLKANYGKQQDFSTEKIKYTHLMNLLFAIRPHIKNQDCLFLESDLKLS